MCAQLLLRWNNHQASFLRAMCECLSEQQLCDLTIACQGRQLHCHKLILSAASRHVKHLLQDNPTQHPIIIMRDVPFSDMQSLLKFVYHGEVTVSEPDLTSFLQTARALEVRGLTDDIQQETGVSLQCNNGQATITTASCSSPSDCTKSGSTGSLASQLEPEVLVVERPVVDVLKSSSAACSSSSSSSVEALVVAVPPASTAVSLNNAPADCDQADDERTPVSRDQHVPGVSSLLDGVLRRSLTLPERGVFCPYCPREVSMRTLGKHITKIHGGQRLQCRACRELVHTRVTSPLIQHGVCVLLQQKQPRLGELAVRRLARQIRQIYKNRRYKSQMLRRYPDLAYFSSSFIFGRVKQACPRCHLVLWSSSMSGHLEKCGEDVVQCDFCNKHMARTRLPLHVDIYHPGKLITRCEQQPAITQPQVKQEQPEFGLDVDDVQLHHPVFSTTRQQQQDGHSPPASVSNVDVLGDSSEQGEDTTPVRVGPATIVACPQCGKKMRQNNVRRHIRVMHSHRAGSGSDVNKRHSLPALLKLGSRCHDAPADQVDKYAQYKGSCSVCGKMMWRKYLHSHMRSAHGELTPRSPPTLQQHEPSSPEPGSPCSAARGKVLRHCPFCWKTMWRCNVKRHIRVMHADMHARLSTSFDLLAEIRAAAVARRVTVPQYALAPTTGDDDVIDGRDVIDDDAGVTATTDDDDAARLAILEMDAMAEAEGMEAAAVVTVSSLDEALERSERVATDTRRHEKHLKRCPFCRKLVRGCHLKRHIMNWHRANASTTTQSAVAASVGSGLRRSASSGGSTKTGVPGGLNPARQRTCPICHKVVVVNNLRRHIRASHPGEAHLHLDNVGPSWQAITAAAGIGTQAGTASESLVTDDDGRGGSELVEVNAGGYEEQETSSSEVRDHELADEEGRDNEVHLDEQPDPELQVDLYDQEYDEDGEDMDSSHSAVEDGESAGRDRTSVVERAGRRLRCCSICNKLMASGNMARHMRTHHNQPPPTVTTDSGDSDVQQAQAEDDGEWNENASYDDSPPSLDRMDGSGAENEDSDAHDDVEVAAARSTPSPCV